MKKKLYRFAKKLVTTENVRNVLLFLVALVFVFYSVSHSEENYFSFESLKNNEIIIASIFLFVASILSKLISTIILKLCEDAAKLGDNNSVVKRYPMETFMMSKTLHQKKTEKIAFIRLCDGKDLHFEIEDDRDSFFELPDLVKDNYDELLDANSASYVYNSLVVRLKDIQIDGDKIKLVTERATYYDGLVTNRVSDYKLNQKKSVRDYYEPGPYLRPLKDSNFSNHLGFSGFIFTSDNQVILTKRNRKASIGKGMYNSSFSAAMKAKYALNEDRIFTEKGLIHSIYQEINDELGIPQDKITRMNIIAVYRDMIEGGKPHLQTLAWTSLSGREAVECFKRDKTHEEQNAFCVSIDDFMKAECYGEYIELPNHKKGGMKKYKFRPGCPALVLEAQKMLKLER